MKKAKLGDVCTFTSGGTPSKSIDAYYHGEIPWITGADIDGPVAYSARSFITPEGVSRSATSIAEEGTVLLVTRTSVGKVAVAGRGLAFSQDITAVTPNDDLATASYITQMLRMHRPTLERQARGATIKGVTRKDVASLEIPLPPLDEQQRIAAILDKADELRTKRREAIAHLDSLTQSIFHSMFGDPSWSRTTLREASLRFIGGRNLVGSVTNSHRENKVLKVNAVSSGSFEHLQTKPLPADYSPPLDHLVREGDLIVTRASGTKDLIGVATPVIHVQNNTYLPDKLWRVDMNTQIVVPTFFRFLTKAPAYREYVANAASGAAGVSNISQAKLLMFEFGLPPIELQQAFATRVAAVERLKETHRKHLAELDALFASLQHRAFKGEL